MIAPGVVLTGSVPVIDVTGSEPVEHRGVGAARARRRSPAPRAKEFPAGSFGLPCGLIIGYRDAGTDSKLRAERRAPRVRPPGSGGVMALRRPRSEAHGPTGGPGVARCPRRGAHASASARSSWASAAG